MRIFRYKKSALHIRIVLIALWLGLVVVPVFFNFYPFDIRPTLDVMVLLFLYSFLPMIYCFYLVQVAQTAVITLDGSSIGYHDKYTRIVARWGDIRELTRNTIRLSNGRAIHIKLGLPALENWRDFEKAVIEKAGLKPAHGKGSQIYRWVRAATQN